MTATPHRGYVATEMAVAAVISAVLSIVFLLLVFGLPVTIPVAGRGGLVMDSVPQTAVIALMSSLVPTWLTRRRVRGGAVASLPGTSWLPRHALVRALAIAVTVAVLGAAAHALLLPLGPAHWQFAAVLAYKPLYGALLGAAVARMATVAALKD